MTNQDADANRYRNDPLSIIEAAERWTDPHVGTARGGPTLIDRARGVQWRLAVAMAGWETFARHRWPGQRHFDCYDYVDVPLRSTIAAPSSRSLDRWLDASTRSDLQDYFSLPSPLAWRVIERWLRGGDIRLHRDAMALAWALRNATVHGHLSPTKLCEWDMRAACSSLTDHVCHVVRASTAA